MEAGVDLMVPDANYRKHPKDCNDFSFVVSTSNEPEHVHVQ
jgi:hypothetical protein